VGDESLGPSLPLDDMGRMGGKRRDRRYLGCGRTIVKEGGFVSHKSLMFLSTEGGRREGRKDDY